MHMWINMHLERTTIKKSFKEQHFIPLTSLRRDAQQLCLIFQTTAATRSNDRKQLERKGKKTRKQYFIALAHNTLAAEKL